MSSSVAGVESTDSLRGADDGAGCRCTAAASGLAILAHRSEAESSRSFPGLTAITATQSSTRTRCAPSSPPPVSRICVQCRQRLPGATGNRGTILDGRPRVG